MDKCKCYHTHLNKSPRYNQITGMIDHYVSEEIAICWGTKECEICDCGGDRASCTFYPEAREKAKQELSLDLKEINEIEFYREYIFNQGLLYDAVNAYEKWKKEHK